MTSYQLVLEDDLLIDYFDFKSGKINDASRVSKLLSYYKPHLTNTDQLTRINKGDDALKQQLVQSGFVSQSIQELSNMTTLKLVLSTNNGTYPYLNIIGPEDLHANFTGTFKNVPRTKAIDHIKNLCAQANRIFIYDKYLKDKSDTVLDGIFSLFPIRQYTLFYFRQQLSQDTISRWKRKNNNVTIKESSLATYKDFHDRYLVIDDQLEIILSSGFDNLMRNDCDFTYILRVLK